MAWFKVDDLFHSHTKTRRAGLEAIGLWTVAGSWSSSQLTDGHVPEWYVETWPRGRKLAAALVAAGYWHPPGHRCTATRQHNGEDIPACWAIEDGWLFHDWRQSNPLRDQVRVDREAKAARQARWRSKARERVSGQFRDVPVDASRDGPVDASRSASQDASRDATPPRPAPPRRKRGGDAPSAPPPADPSGASGGANGKLDGLAALQELDRQQADYEREQRQRFHNEMPDIFPSPEDA